MNTQSEPTVNIDEFMAVFPIIVNDLTSGINIDTPELKTHIEDFIRYILPNGKKFRGLLVPETFKLVAKKEELTPENIRLSYIGGWIVEMAQAVALLMDDIVDKSPTRRGLPCWHTKKEIGLSAIKDGFFLQEAWFFVFRKYFSKDITSVKIYKLMHHGILQSVVGQIYDCMTKKDGKLVIDFFTMEKYKNLVKLKTSYGFLVPVLFTFHLAKISNELHHEQAKCFMTEMAENFQIQDDFLDCFGDEGARGEDIREAKCTWLAVKALEMANSEQRELFEKHYGREEPESVDTICKLYQDLELPKLYVHWEDEMYKKMRRQIQELPAELPTPVFSKILERFYKRIL